MEKADQIADAVAGAIESGICDVDRVPDVLTVLRASIPGRFRALIEPSKDGINEIIASCVQRLREARKTSEELREADQAVAGFTYLCALLATPMDRPDLPDFVDRARVVSDNFDESELNLKQDMNGLSRFVENALHAVGHRHTNEAGSPGVGQLEESAADAAFAALRDSWGEDADDFETWLIPYLVFRLIEIIRSFDMFHAMYGGIPRYLEFKITGYLLWLCGRGKYSPAAGVSQVAHELLHLIRTQCRASIQQDDDLGALQSAIEQTLGGAMRLLAKQRKAMEKAEGRVVQNTLRVFSTFMESYLKQLEKTGQFHAAMWSLPMFEEARDVFRVFRAHEKAQYSVLLIGETGTGKESIAELFLSGLGKKYVALNCAGVSWQTMSEDLFSLLDDHASHDPVGALLLDEIDKSHIDAQGGLLRLLDKPKGEYRQPGQPHSREWEGSAVATATELLFSRAREQAFLPDLLWRFDERITIRPLRDMARTPEVLRKLLAIALQNSAHEHGMKGALQFTERQLAELLAYRWPGNLREVLTLTASMGAWVVASEGLRERCVAGEDLYVPDELFDVLLTRSSSIAARLSGSLD